MHCRQHLGTKLHTLPSWVVLAREELKTTSQITDRHHNNQVLLFILTQFVMYLCTGHDGPETSCPESLVEFSRLCLVHKLLPRNCVFCVKLSILFRLHKGQSGGDCSCFFHCHPSHSFSSGSSGSPLCYPRPHDTSTKAPSVLSCSLL